ncbi:CHAD domain-containing protein [Siccirubricoccus deserti]
MHQLRVALRRLRSVLKVLRPAVRCPEVDGFDVGLKRLAARLGPARDWDVFLGGMGAAVAAALSGERRIATLLKAAEARRQTAYAALRQELEGPGFRLLVLDGLALLLQRPWHGIGCALGQVAAVDAKPRLPPDTPLEDFAAQLLDRRWRKLADKGEDIAEHGAEALHELRLEAKRLRYAAELFAPLWPGKSARRFQKRLAALQEALGLANDASVARGLVASLGSKVPAWAVGAVEGYATARALPARKHALAAWEDLRLAAFSGPRSEATTITITRMRSRVAADPAGALGVGPCAPAASSAPPLPPPLGDPCRRRRSGARSRGDRRGGAAGVVRLRPARPVLDCRSRGGAGAGRRHAPPR